MKIKCKDNFFDASNSQLPFSILNTKLLHQIIFIPVLSSDGPQNVEDIWKDKITRKTGRSDVQEFGQNGEKSSIKIQ